MQRHQDLDRLDSATLRLWRWSNLVGWGITGALVTSLLGAATNVVTGRLVDQGHQNAGNALAILMIFVSCVAGGAVVGARVYRAPRLVAFLSQVAAGLGWATWQRVVVHGELNTTAVVYNCIFVLLLASLAALAADAVWNRRPRALRNGASAGGPSPSQPSAS